MNETMRNRVWAKNFKGTAREFIEQAKKLGLTDRSISYWMKYNWNIKGHKTQESEPVA